MSNLTQEGQFSGWVESLGTDTITVDEIREGGRMVVRCVLPREGTNLYPNDSVQVRHWQDEAGDHADLIPVITSWNHHLVKSS